ncbi:MAG TPA: ATP-binding protein, partial [Gaiellales bacterium]|nr:ATP-binding protein [Gaiellales bacterium]
MPVEVTCTLAHQLPQAVEIAAYYVVSESLANVAKYAQATSVAIRLRRDGDRAFVEVRDDGVGGADPELGSGLRGLA